MIEIYHVDEKSSFELDRLVQMYTPTIDLFPIMCTLMNLILGVQIPTIRS